MPSIDNPTAAAAAANNGGSTEPQLDEALVELLRSRVAERQRRVEELQAEIDEIKPELRKYEKVLAVLTDEPTTAPTAKPKSKRKGKAALGEEGYEKIKAAALHYAEDHEEFRAVDIRNATGETSSRMTMAFERMRQDNLIRLARREGNSKFFRLTPTGARER